MTNELTRLREENEALREKMNTRYWDRAKEDNDNLRAQNQKYRAKLEAAEQDRDRKQRNLDTAQAALCGASKALRDGDADEAHGWLTRQEAYEKATAWKRDLEGRAEAAEKVADVAATEIKRLANNDEQRRLALVEAESNLAAARERIAKLEEDSELLLNVSYAIDLGRSGYIAELQDAADANRCIPPELNPMEFGCHLPDEFAPDVEAALSLHDRADKAEADLAAARETMREAAESAKALEAD